nr:hypothetical protein StreXyl84_42170 [Streptomyces sp. Xyl84]
MTAPAHLLLPALSDTALSDPAGPEAALPKPGAGPAPEHRPPADHRPDASTPDGLHLDEPQTDAFTDVFTSEAAYAEAPLTSEPPLPDAEPLTSEPPFAEAAPLTSESTADTDPCGAER